MKIFGLNISRYQNIDKPKPKPANINSQVVERQTIRVQQDIDEWRNAIQIAESVINPDRLYLQRLYNEIILDPHISALVQQIVRGIDSMEVHVYKDGEKDEDSERIFQSSWYEDFVYYVIEAHLFGYSLIEFGGIKNDQLTDVSVVDRRNVIPGKGVKKDLYNSSDLIKYYEEPYSLWSIMVDVGDFGLLNKAAPFWIYKKQAMNSWAEYQQIMGMPLRLGKTDIRSEDRRNNMRAMLENMGSAAWGVFDMDDTVEFVTATGSGDGNAFKDTIDLCDAQMSKLFVGQTMTSDNGSSLSQAQVHKEIFDMVLGGYIKTIENITNDKLIPLMQRHGLLNGNYTVEFEYSKGDMEYSQKVDTIAKLAPYFDFDPDYIKEYLDIEVEEKMTTPSASIQNYMTGIKNCKH